MYSTCVFCHADLGTNESVEHFPIGRRLAFDAPRGRLWVVCRKCERWNLTPLEERWEAIEECARLFSGTKMRVSTDEIGLARLRDGLELVRIGEPQRPEMAAWRYGDQFGRRRRKNLIVATSFGVAAVAVGLVGPATGIAAGGLVHSFNLLMITRNYRAQRRRLTRVTTSSGKTVDILANSAKDARIFPDGDTWQLSVVYEKPSGPLRRLLHTMRPPETGSHYEAAVVKGDEALRVAARLLPSLNHAGGKPTDVSAAVELIERSENAHALFNSFIVGKKRGYGRAATRDGATTTLAHLPVSARLALEMVTHEDAERRALEGELHLLEAAWQEAEEVAAIADNLLVTDGERQQVSSPRGQD